MSFDHVSLGKILKDKGYIRGPFGSALKRQELSNEGIPVYEQQQAINGHRNFRFFVDNRKYEKLKRFRVQPNDLIVSCSGTVGRVSVISKSDPIGIISQALLILRPDVEQLLPRFLYYFLISKQGQAELLNASHGAVQQNIAPRAVVEKIPTPLPTKRVQADIVSTLGALDDRITLLRETNKTLEFIAQTIFKSWFVNFDPVRAKMEGRQPEGMDEETAALFPDAFEQSELGLIPKKWKSSQLGEECAYISRGVSPKYVEEGGVLVINQKCIREFALSYEKARRHDHLKRNVDGRLIQYGDVLINSTGVGTLGRVAQVINVPENMIVDSHVTVVRAGKNLDWCYLGQLLISKQPEIEDMGEGTTGQTELSRAKISAFSILVPEQPVLNRFKGIISNLQQKISLNQESIQSLSELRDLLLPRLISGQLRVSNAAEVEELAVTSQ